jgi:osmotically-inducible protein OsmY
MNRNIKNLIALGRHARSFAVAVACGIAVPPLVATESPSVTEGVFADCRLTIFARQALQQDPLLSGFNLGISVNGRAARLWGAVPSMDLSTRAEKLVAEVPGIGTVKNELRVEKATHADNGTHVKSLSPPKPFMPSPKVERPTNASATLTGSGPPTAAAAPIQTAAVTLKPPVPRAIPMGTERPQQSDLETHLRNIVQRDRRFQHVGLDVNCGVVYLRGGIKRWSDLLELAQVVSRVPGVQRVILNEMRLNRLEPLYLP